MQEEKNSRISFLGTESYRDYLKEQAFRRKISVQTLLELAVECFLDSNENRADSVAMRKHEVEIAILLRILGRGGRGSELIRGALLMIDEMGGRSHPGT